MNAVCSRTVMRGMIGTLAALLTSAAAMAVDVQPPDNQTNANAAHAQPPASDCQTCHFCTTPTAADPCLRICTRAAAGTPVDRKQPYWGPDVVILDELEDAYLPVPFDHHGHAEMANMTRGCVVCHHYTPQGQSHPACKTCHEASSERLDIRKPGLKGDRKSVV